MENDLIILEIPELPPKIQNALENRELAVFLGAGVSRVMGLPSWEELSNILIDKCLSLELINHNVKMYLSNNEKDNKIKISICKNLLKKKENEYYDTLCKKFNYEKLTEKDKEKVNQKNIYRVLKDLFCIFITTNVDDLFHGCLKPDQIKYTEDDFKKRGFCLNNLYHIHGMIKDKNSMVFTSQEYLDRYKNNTYLDFLKELFKSYTVLFIGYGLSEFEILDYLLEKVKDESNKEHFFLYACLESEKFIYKLYEEYYRSINVALIPYNISKKGYNQIYYVIEDWVNKLKYTSSYKSNSIDIIDNIIKNNGHSKMKNIYKIIYNHTDLEEYFFKKLLDPNLNLNFEKWFDEIKNHDLFNPKRNPDYDFKNNKEKTRWIILIFLEKIFGKNESLNKKIIKETNNIIEYTTENENISNQFTNQLIIKILNHLNIEQIGKKHIEFIKKAIKNEYDNNRFLDSFKEGLFKKIIKDDNDYFEDIINSLLEVLETKGIMYEYQLGLYSKIIIDELNPKFYPKLIEILENKMKIIMKEKSLGYLAQVYGAFADNHKLKNFDFHYQIFDLMKNILIKPNNDKNRICKKIKEYLEAIEVIFKKIAIYAISKRYDDFEKVFWNYFKNKNPLSIKYCKNEIRNFFSENNKRFTDEQIDKIIQWTNEKYDNCPEDTKIIAKNKKKILSCLLDTDNEKVKKLYDYYNKIDSTPIIPPNEEIPLGTVRIVEPKAKYKADFLLSSNYEIVKKINEFKSDLRDDIYDLPHSISVTFKSNPDKFINNLDPFLELKKPEYLLSFINTISNNINEDSSLEKIFIFIEGVLKKIDEDKNKDFKKFQEKNGLQFESAFINLFEILLIKIRNINLVHLDKIVDILIEFTKKQFKDYYYQDLITKFINSKYYKIYNLLINILIKINEIEKNGLPKKLKEFFSGQLKQKDEIFLFTSGERLADLYYIDEEWLIKNYKNIFDEDDEKNWVCVMIGYLSNLRNIRKETYNLLKKESYLSKALDTNFENELINKSIVHQITLSYFNDNESMEDKNSLIEKLIDTGTTYQIEIMINYIHNMYKDSKYEKKTVALWKRLMKKDLINDKNENTTISKCLFWIENLNKTKKEDLEFIKEKNYKIDSETTLYDLIYIFSDKAAFYPELIAELFLEIVKNNNINRNIDSEIIDLLEILYKTASKETVNSICQTLINKEHEKIYEVCRKYKKVYISISNKRKDKKYHTKDCQYFKENYEEITLEEAKEKEYTPCSKCNPPE